uniref:Uncharacterized protein n=1 Tax=Manihot esculenta TaxID=3983 RepID=A0A2C9VZE9_MANES
MSSLCLFVATRIGDLPRIRSGSQVSACGFFFFIKYC